MRKAFAVMFAAVAMGAFSAPVPQASQAWVEMKVEKLKAEIMSVLSTSATNGVSDAQAAENAVSVGMSEMSGIIRLGTTISPAVSEGNPFYILAPVYSGYTNMIPNNTILSYSTNSTYTNDVATITDAGATNILTFGNVSLYCPTNSHTFYPVSGEGYVMAVKVGR